MCISLWFEEVTFTRGLCQNKGINYTTCGVLFRADSIVTPQTYLLSIISDPALETSSGSQNSDVGRKRIGQCKSHLSEREGGFLVKAARCRHTSQRKRDLSGVFSFTPLNAEHTRVTL